MIWWLSLGLFLGVSIGFVLGAWWASRGSIEEYLRDADRRNAELEAEFARKHPEMGPLKDKWSIKPRRTAEQLDELARRLRRE